MGFEVSNARTIPSLPLSSQLLPQHHTCLAAAMLHEDRWLTLLKL